MVSSTALAGQMVLWKPVVQGGDANFTYTWNGTDFPGGFSVGDWYAMTYDTVGQKNMQLLVGSAGVYTTVFCNTVTISMPTPTVTPVAIACETDANTTVGKINVSWNSVPGAASYKLYRGNSVDFTPSDTNQVDADPNTAGVQSFSFAPSSSAPFADSGLVPETVSYRYKLTSFSGINGGGNSSPASSLSAIYKASRYCSPGNPVAPTATPGACVMPNATTGQVTISWGAPASDLSNHTDGNGPVDYYFIYENGSLVTQSGVNISPYIRANRSGGVAYTYQIEAVGKGDINSSKVPTPIPLSATVPVCKPDLTPLGATGATPGPNAPVVTAKITNPDGTVRAGTNVTLDVNPANIGAGFGSPDFIVRLQRKVANAGDGTYVDFETVNVAGGLLAGSVVNGVFTPVGATVNKSIIHLAIPAGSYDFRYCIDPIQNLFPPIPGIVGNVDEVQVSNSADNTANVGEYNNCSGSVPLVSTVAPPITITFKVRNSNTAPNGAYINGPLLVNYGDSVDINWTSTFATGCTASTVTTPLDPTHDWTGVKSTSGTDLNIGPLSSGQYIYTINCTGLGTPDTRSLTVNVAMPTLSCSGTLSGTIGNWSATPSPISLPSGLSYSYIWTGTDIPENPVQTGVSSATNDANSYSINYTLSGSKTTMVRMTPTGRAEIPANCTTTIPDTVCPGVNNLCPKPDLTPLDPPNKPILNGGTANVTAIAGSGYTLAAQPKNIGVGTNLPFEVTFEYKVQGSASDFSNLPSTATVNGLSAGATVTTSDIIFGTDALIPQIIDLRYCVDKLPDDGIGAVPESNEFNNCSGSITLTLVKGTLSCTPRTSGIDLSWTQTNGTNVSLFRGSTLVQSVTGASGTVNDLGITPGIPYTYYLRNGATTASLQLATATCTPEYPDGDASLEVRKAGLDPFVSTSVDISYGDKVDLKWTSINDATCSASTVTTPSDPAHDWTGSKSELGGTDLNIGPLSSTQYVYQLTCLDKNGHFHSSNPVQVNVASPIIACAVNDPLGVVGTSAGHTFTWTSLISPAQNTLTGGLTYSYLWSGTNIPTTEPNTVGVNNTVNPYSINYLTSGSKNATFTLTATGNRVVPLACGTVTAKPDLTPKVLLDGSSHPEVKSGSFTLNSGGNYRKGTNITFIVDPKNIGAGFSSPTFAVKLQRKIQGGAYDGTFVGTVDVLGGLLAGESVSKEITTTLPATPDAPTVYDFRYCIDSTEVVDEINELNNCSDDKTLTATKATCVDLGNCVPIIDSFKVRNSNSAPSGAYSDGPITVNYGDSVDLQWTSSNTSVNGCSASTVATPLNTGTWTPDSGKPASGTDLNVGRLSSSQYTYTITCTGPGGSTPRSLVVNVNAPDLACSVDGGVVGNPDAGHTFTWTSLISPAQNTLTGGLTYSYLWSGTNISVTPGTAGVSNTTNSTNPYSINYTTSGSKNATFTLTATGNRVVPLACGTVTAKADLAPLGAAGTNLTGLPNAPVVTNSTTNPDGTVIVGTNVTFRGDPKNIGAGFSSPNFVVKLQRKVKDASDATYTNFETVSVPVSVGNSFDAGDTKNANMVHAWPVSSVGSFEFRYCIDSTDVVDEINESNNCSGSIPLTGGTIPLPTVDLYVTYNTVDYLKNVAGGTMAVAYASTPVLKWTSLNATDCTSSDFSTGTVANNTTNGVDIGPLSNATKTYLITCTGLGGSGTDTATVTVAPPTLSCSGTLNALVGTWTATPVPVGIPVGLNYSYVWSGSEITPGSTGIPSPSQGINSLNVTYTTSGSKSASVSMLPTGVGQPFVNADCTPVLITKPDLIPKVLLDGSSHPEVKSGSFTLNEDSFYRKGTNITFIVDPKNIGAGFSLPTFAVKLQRKIQGGDYDGTFVGTVDVLGGLLAGESVSKEITTTLPATPDAPTVYDFRYCIDSTEVVDEINELNNCSGDQTLTTTKASCTDLGNCPVTTTLNVRKSGVNPYTHGPLTVNSGDSVDLNWTSTNASQNGCTASSVPLSGTGSWSGAGKSSSGTEIVGSLSVVQYVYTITCTGPGPTGSDSVTVNVVQPLVVSCSPSPTANLKEGSSVTWTATVTGGVSPYTYLWSGDAPLASSVPTTNNFSTVSYSTGGFKTGKVTVTDSNSTPTTVGPIECGNVTVIDTHCDDSNSELIISPQVLEMSFISNSATSKSARVSISPAGGCSQSWTLDPTTAIITDSLGKSVPVKINFYSVGTKNLNKIISSGQYSVGLDMNVTSSKIIAPSVNPTDYTLTITATGSMIDEVTQNIPVLIKTFRLNVSAVKPGFQEF
ncbi:MAG: hypothetical protein EXS46_01075 [Candidatus Taylorbacteria bacterium]|nr:hypothetical protein [Candidatus Taylorbacteria bacterium]